MPARLISIPFILLTGVFTYLTLEKDENYSICIIFFVILLSVIYTLSPQINWWWYKRNPPDIDQEMRNLLIKHHVFYNDLSVEDKKRFRNRMALYMMAVEFIPKGWEQLPEDIKGVIAANVVQMTFQQDDFLLSKFERIVVYTTPFPSPQFPETLHASEVFEEDGVLLFSAQQIMWSFLQPQQYYNLVLHEYVKIYRMSYPAKFYPITSWPVVEQISGFSQKQIEGIIGLSDIDPSLVSGTLYFTHPQKYRGVAPKLYEKWQVIFS
ncbi:MAG: zinc-dependent peptidase [Bacteroidota bacterium]